MTTVYVYILDTLADWEQGYVTAELNSKRFFKKNAPLLLSGANTWDNPMHDAIIDKAREFLSIGAMVGAICGVFILMQTLPASK